MKSTKIIQQKKKEIFVTFIIHAGHIVIKGNNNKI